MSSDEPSSPRNRQDGWPGILREINTPLHLCALTALLFEAAHGAALLAISEQHRFWAFALFGVFTLIVVGLALWFLERQMRSDRALLPVDLTVMVQVSRRRGQVLIPLSGAIVKLFLSEKRIGEKRTSANGDVTFDVKVGPKDEVAVEVEADGTTRKQYVVTSNFLHRCAVDC